MIVRSACSLLVMLVLVTAPIFAANAPDRKEASPSPTPTAPTSASVTALNALLKECRFEYFESGPGTYNVLVPGKQVPRHKLFVATYEGLVLVGTVVARKADIPKSSDLATRLLRFNHDFDRVKVALDNDGDLVVRVDLTLRILDATELRANIEQVSASADEILSILQSASGK